MNAALRWMVLAGMVVFVSAAQAQQPLVMRSGSTGPVAMGQRYVSPWSGSLRWLINESVKKDLELSDEQIQAINEIRAEVQEETRSFYKDMGKLPAEERRTKYYERNKELAEKTEERLQKVLLREQNKRLEEISLQTQMRSYYGVGQQLTSDDLAEKLGLTKRQIEKIQKRSQEVRAEVMQKTRDFQAKLQAEAREEILKALTPSQRKTLEKMMGDSFEWKATAYGRGGASGGAKKPN